MADRNEASAWDRLDFASRRWSWIAFAVFLALSGIVIVAHGDWLGLLVVAGALVLWMVRPRKYGSNDPRTRDPDSD